MRARARMLSAIRGFFAERGVLEVETPLLCRAAGADPNLDLFVSRYRGPGTKDPLDLYLQTSPEFAMKRLLAAGSGPIYQICKAFRNGESGRFHNPEFTLLEWYRPGFTLEDLMDETEQLLRWLLDGRLALKAAERVSYREAFRDHAGIDPVTAAPDDLLACAKRHRLSGAETLDGSDITAWLDFLFSHLVQPHLGEASLCMVYDYPACQAALARIAPEDPSVAERVELFLDGLELANGFRELSDAWELERRFDADLRKRESLGLPLPAKDDRLLAALRSGLPECCGISVGLDRVLMLIEGAESIDGVLTFPLMRT